jgi:hypothetical protein
VMSPDPSIPSSALTVDSIDMEGRHLLVDGLMTWRCALGVIAPAPRAGCDCGYTAPARSLATHRHRRCGGRRLRLTTIRGAIAHRSPGGCVGHHGLWRGGLEDTPFGRPGRLRSNGRQRPSAPLDIDLHSAGTLLPRLSTTAPTARC